MGAIGYLYRRILANRIKMALRRPVTYFYIVVFLIYMFAVPMSLKILAQEYRLDAPDGMAAVLTLFAFWVIPANLIAYARRKGLVFRSSDIHFLFPSPTGPKQILLYAHLKSLAAQTMVLLFVVCCGGTICGVPAWKLAVYFFFALVVENVLEGSIMMVLYGSERLDEKKRGLVIRGAYALVGILVVMGIYTYFQKGLSFQTIVGFLHSDLVQLVPVIGWYIAVIHLLFAGATVVNVTGTVLYFLLTAAVLITALRMKCTGAYYEDAIKFAEDYEEVLASRRQGNTEKRLGKKQKFGKASVVWRGKGAKALFYRQLLEYKKSRYFIFDLNTAAALIAGIGLAWLYVEEGGFEAEIFTNFVIPGLSAYLILIFTAVNGKWAKELKSPYTYMIPDTPFRKLMQATAMQHVQNLINGLLITIPGAVVMKMTPMRAALCVIFYMALAANKLYALAVAEAVVGGTLGTVGKQMFQLFLQSFVIMLAILGAVTGSLAGGTDLAYLMMDVFLVLATAIFMVLAALNFYRMETS